MPLFPYRCPKTVLRDLTDQDLKDLGVVLGDRRKLLRAIAELHSGPSGKRSFTETVATAAPQETAERR